jgi:hypothetical protein
MAVVSQTQAVQKWWEPEKHSGLTSRQQLPKLGRQTKTCCCNWWKGITAIHQRKSPSSLCSPWWSWWLFEGAEFQLAGPKQSELRLAFVSQLGFSTDLCTILPMSFPPNDTLQHRAKPTCQAWEEIHADREKTSWYHLSPWERLRSTTITWQPTPSILIKA